MVNTLRNLYYKRRIKEEKHKALFEKYRGEEVVSFDCETTGLNPKEDEIISIGAIKIKGNKILASQKLSILIKTEREVSSESIKIHHIREIDLKEGMEKKDAMELFLDFIGNRPLLGYYLEFDIAMINKTIKPLFGFALPNKAIELSALYYDKKIELIPQGNIDLRFDTIMEDLKIPSLGKHSAYNDALMTAMMYVKLQSVKSLRA